MIAICQQLTLAASLATKVTSPELIAEQAVIGCAARQLTACRTTTARSHYRQQQQVPQLLARILASRRLVCLL